MKTSQIQRAVDFLNENRHLEYSPQTLKRLLALDMQESTLGRKLRDKATQRLIHRTYKRIASGEEIAVYSGKEELGNGGEPVVEHAELNPHNPTVQDVLF